MTTSAKKTFVLDTSILIHDPESIFNFGDNNIAIPIEVIQELDRIKTESSERGQSARSVQRKLLRTLSVSPEKSSQLPEGGTIQILVPPAKITENGNGEIRKIVGDMSVPDHKIIAATQWLDKQNPETETILVTKDMGMMLKGRAVGLTVEDYKFDKTADDNQNQVQTIEISSKEYHQFESSGEIELKIERDTKLPINSYGLFIGGPKKIPWRHIGFGRFLKLECNSGINVPNGIHIQSRNLEQLFALDALLNPNIHLVTISGQAGTGKTLLTVAAGLFLIGKKNYTGMCIAKPNESIGKENGFLPGSLEEKLRPWLQPYADALNFLHHKKPPQNKKQSERKRDQINRGGGAEGPAKRPYDLLTEAGIVEVTAIEYIRGRSIPNKLFILDECQNVPQKVIKTIASRMAEGSKLICLGDLEQIDNPYLDRYSNGLAHIRANMKGLTNAAHLTLIKGERSLLAEQAAALL